MAKVFRWIREQIISAYAVADFGQWAVSVMTLVLPSSYWNSFISTLPIGDRIALEVAGVLIGLLVFIFYGRYRVHQKNKEDARLKVIIAQVVAEAFLKEKEVFSWARKSMELEQQEIKMKIIESQLREKEAAQLYARAIISLGTDTHSIRDAYIKAIYNYFPSKNMAGHLVDLSDENLFIFKFENPIPTDYHIKIGDPKLLCIELEKTNTQCKLKFIPYTTNFTVSYVEFRKIEFPSRPDEQHELQEGEPQ